MNSIYVFTPKCGSSITHVLLTVQNTRWICTQTKLTSIDRHKPITTELGQDETLTVAYNFRETKSCNHFFFYFPVAKTVAKSSQVHV